MTARLSESALGDLTGSATIPRYDRKAVEVGIVHLGVGAFHRAHQAVYVDDCLAAGETAWGIAGVSLRSPDTCDALAPQDGLYTLAVRSGEGERLRIVGSMKSLLVAPEDPQAVLALLSDPAIRIVTLTVTEKAYLRAAGGGLDATHPDIVHDLANPAAPRTVHGFLAEALERRLAAGIAPFTVLSCDNLPDNGGTLRKLVIEFAQLRDPALGRHVAGTVAFPSSMVDRIVPATTDADRARVSATLGVKDAWPVMTEPFSQWVVEDRFSTGRPAWEQFGATMVDDVQPYEEMKLRLLNGAHSGIAYLGLLSGHGTVDDAFADPEIRRFVDGLWVEAAPTLAEGLDTAAYTRDLAKRFANPALAHRTAQIANDGSQKLPQRIVSTMLARIGDDASARHLALVPAAWIAACEARGRSLPAGHFSDPLDAGIADLMAKQLDALNMTRAIFDLAGFAKGETARDAIVQLVADHLETLRKGGSAGAFASLAPDGKNT